MATPEQIKAARILAAALGLKGGVGGQTAALQPAGTGLPPSLVGAPSILGGSTGQPEFNQIRPAEESEIGNLLQKALGVPGQNNPALAGEFSGAAPAPSFSGDPAQVPPSRFAKNFANLVRGVAPSPDRFPSRASDLPTEPNAPILGPNLKTPLSGDFLDPGAVDRKTADRFIEHIPADFTEEGVDGPDTTKIDKEQAAINAQLKKLLAAQAQQQGIIDKLVKNPSTGPDFSKAREALESARPGPPEQLSTGQQIALALGGAASAVAGISPEPGNFGAAFAAAGAGFLKGTISAKQQNRDRRERTTEQNRQVTLAQAQQEAAIATAIDSGKRADTRLALQATSNNMSNLIKLTKIRASQLSGDKLLNVLKAKKLQLEIADKEITLRGNRVIDAQLRQALKLGLNAKIVEEHGVIVAFGMSILDGTAGLPQERLTLEASGRRKFAASELATQVKSDATDEEISEAVSRALLRDPKLQDKLDKLTLLAANELLSEKDGKGNRVFLQRLIDKAKFGTLPVVPEEPAPPTPQEIQSRLQTQELSTFIGGA